MINYSVQRIVKKNLVSSNMYNLRNKKFNEFKDTKDF